MIAIPRDNHGWTADRLIRGVIKGMKEGVGFDEIEATYSQLETAANLAKQTEATAKSAYTAYLSVCKETRRWSKASKEQDQRYYELERELKNAQKMIAKWIAVSDEKPDADTTVLIANNDWSDPVIEGYFDGEAWCNLEGYKLNLVRPGDGLMTQEWAPPTHWMDLPKPPVALVSTNPFAVTSMPGCITAGVEDRLYRVKQFNAKEVRAALALPNLEKTVRIACERRLRKLEKAAK